ncbi:MAG: hypothetical protein R3E82_23270 [Pseudomonadales bacterium]
MTMLLGIIATSLTLVVAIYSAVQDRLPMRYKAMIIIASVATMAQSVRAVSEQHTFEKQVLGGDSYVYLTFEDLDESSSKFIMRQDGEEYPVYDVYVEIYDVRKFTGMRTRDPREFAKRMQYVQRSVFGPETVTSVLNNFHPSDCYGYWLAVTQQRNGPVMSLINARKLRNKWESSTRVFSMDDEQSLIREYPSQGWDTQSAWPTVSLQGGGINFRTPEQSCVDE